MASHVSTNHAAPRPIGVGSVRRMARSLARRPWARPGLAERLRGTLPLRYPSDPADPFVDALTGLASQPTFVEALEEWSERSRHGSEPFSLLLLDIDGLARVNATFGPVAGDRLILRLAAILRDLARPGVRSFRIGSDEYAVLLAGAGPGDARAYAEAALAAFANPRDESEPGSFSAGIAGMPWASRDPSDVYRQALAALAWVKGHGRSGCAAFEPDTHGVPAATDGWRADVVEKVVSQRQLRPVFQPIVDLGTGRIVGFEGLVRTDATQAGTSTRELFEAAAACGRVAELDLACIEAVVGAARAVSPDRILSVNLSARTLAGREFEPGWLLQHLVDAGISPRRVVVEISDGEPVDDIERLDRTLVELRRAGLRVAADDVSVDDPSRRLLRHMPFDIVKIDLSRMWHGAHSGPALAALRDTALGHRARVVAEGVETSEQFLAIRDLDIGTAQGYLFGRPDASLGERAIDMRRIETEAEAGGQALPEAHQDEIWPLDDELNGQIVAERLSSLLPPARGVHDAVAGRA